MNNTSFLSVLEQNKDDLQMLGFIFLQLLQADFCVLSPRPSAVLAAIMAMEQQGALHLDRPLVDLISHLDATGVETLMVNGQSILRF